MESTLLNEIKENIKQIITNIEFEDAYKIMGICLQYHNEYSDALNTDNNEFDVIFGNTYFEEKIMNKVF